MSGLVIDEALCVGCGLCARSCASGGIEASDGVARVTESCVACGMCVDACPTGALSIERGTSPERDPDGCRDVWVFAQQDAGEVVPVAYELLGKGRELAGERGCRLVAVLGEGAEAGRDNVDRLVAAGADEVVRCRDDRLARPDAEVYARWICRLAGERRPETILYGATAFGRELAPAVAVRLGTGLTADCTGLEVDGDSGLLRQTRPAFGGNLMATIVCPAHRPQMSTVRPGVFAAPGPDPEHAGKLVEVSLDEDIVPRVRVLEAIPRGAGGSIADADVLVVVGRGIGSRKALPLMREFARLVGGELGCTRPLVESGWCDYPCQVGQTGVSVAPRLLVSVGVSGAVQHLAGIGGAEVVVAINEDSSAPIFGVSQYSVVGDCIQVVDELVGLLSSREGR